MTIETCQDVVIFRPEGETLDMRNATAFREEIRPIVNEGKHVVLDMSGVHFVDSTGLGALLSLMRGLAAQDGSLRMAGLQDQVLNMFRLVRMNMVFDIYGSVDEAMEGWSH